MPTRLDGLPAASEVAGYFPSAARTATVNGADQDNPFHGGIMVFLDVTAASGTGGLQVQVQEKDPVSGNYVGVNALPAAVIATGTTAYLIAPGGSSAGALAQSTANLLPRTFRIRVVHGDGTSYTYSVSYCLLP